MFSARLAVFGLLLLAAWCGTPLSWAAAPAAPTFLRSYATSASAVTIMLDDNSTNETAFGFVAIADGGAPEQFSLPSESGAEADRMVGWTFNALSMGTVYTFAACALNGSEASAMTNTITIKTGDFAPPTSLMATTLAEGFIALTWSDNAFSESGYFVEYRELPSGDWMRDGSSSANNCVALLDHSAWMIPTRSYEFRVQGFKGTASATTGTTAFSATATASLPNLAAPSEFTVTPSDAAPDKISFAWKDNSTMEHAFEIEYRKQDLSNPKPFTLLRTVGASATSLANLPEFEPGIIYEFRIRALFYVSAYESVASDYSAVVAAATRNGIKSKPYAPITLGALFNYPVETQSLSQRTSLNVGPLPSGLAFNSQESVISGTIQTAGLYTIPITASFADGSSHSQPLVLRVVNPPAAPKVVAPIPAQTLSLRGSAILLLDSSFADPDTERAVRVHTTKGNLDFILYPSVTPQTVSNFVHYAGAYADSLFHRLVPGFVLQGGGYYYYPGYDLFTHVLTENFVWNEPGLSNLAGTVAMAKQPDLPDSATSEFFINLADNSANLDYQNGGFTVFGRVSAPSLSVLSSLAAIPNYTESIRLYDSATMTTGQQTWSNLPIDGDGIPGVISVQEILPLVTYSMVTPPNNAVATARLDGVTLQITPVASGTTQITVAATDLDGNTTTQTIDITVQKNYIDWAEEQGMYYSNPATRRPDGLTNLHAFAFMEDQAHGLPIHLPTFDIKASDPTPRAKITFPVRKFAANLTYVVEASSTLASNDWTTLWTSADGFNAANVAATEDLADRTVVTVADTQPAASSTRRFLRVRLVTP